MTDLNNKHGRVRILNFFIKTTVDSNKNSTLHELPIYIYIYTSHVNKH